MHSGAYPPPQHLLLSLPVLNFVCFIYLLFLTCQVKGLLKATIYVFVEHVGGAVLVLLVGSKDKL